MKLKWPNQAECQISKKMRLLVESMLQIDPEKRPSGKDLIELTEHFVNQKIKTFYQKKNKEAQKGFFNIIRDPRPQGIFYSVNKGNQWIRFETYGNEIKGNKEG